MPSDSHVAPAPGTPDYGNAPVLSQPRPGPGVIRGRTAAFSLLPSLAGLGAGHGIAGAQWLSTAGAGALVLHPRLITAAGAAARTLLCPHPREPPAHCCVPGCSCLGLVLGLLCLAFPGLLCALGAIPGAGHHHPRQEARGGAEGYFTGYFTCWHQLFLPSAPNCVLQPPACC